ncbi:hypothetical protein HERIO_1430 [Hepatospora eriocheir]|uniref:Uncharacterized protein n=1 Tax=Hepatospora eriocheir TaxID=1081669 RepID=A0A1X0QA43_9MICR|nr:hypothetical protein HERIO_1430 [Hepatospora eriocheir]
MRGKRIHINNKTQQLPKIENLNDLIKPSFTIDANIITNLIKPAYIGVILKFRENNTCLEIDLNTLFKFLIPISAEHVNFLDKEFLFHILQGLAFRYEKLTTQIFYLIENIPCKKIIEELLLNHILQFNTSYSNVLYVNIMRVVVQFKLFKISDYKVSFYRNIILRIIFNFKLEDLTVAKNTILYYCDNNGLLKIQTIKKCAVCLNSSKYMFESKLIIINVARAVLLCYIPLNMTVDFTNLIISGIKTKNVYIMEVVFLILKSSTGFEYVVKNIDDILPKIFDIIFNIVEKTWKKEVKIGALEFLINMNSVNNNLFQSCIESYNYRRHNRKRENSE